MITSPASPEERETFLFTAQMRESIFLVLADPYLETKFQIDSLWRKWGKELGFRPHTVKFEQPTKEPRHNSVWPLRPWYETRYFTAIPTQQETNS